jgi:four helix bundle protein
MIRSFKDLEVWQNAMDAAMEVFFLSKRFPSDERYSLTDQIRRSSRSVASQISEGWRKRRYLAAFKNKLNEAEGEAAETQTWIEVSRRCGYWTDEIAADLDKRYDQILAQLVKMHENAENWCSGVRNASDR